MEPKRYENGLKENWKEFMDDIQERVNLKGLADHEDIYFVYNSVEPETAYFFEYHVDLDDWLERIWHEWDYGECLNVEDSMEDWKVWKLVTENDVKRFPTTNKKAKKTTMRDDGETIYRKLVPVSVEPAVVVSTPSV
ncbi:hypothetical protein [Bacillus licheniformis]|uniref:hypothetical protein n=1 Tax=Bacillus licheniformis TaxID=1402 RepID=UPI001BA45833|nr:hypothetical protein [Bacillus licheniformis]MBS2764002.1 hypothetical protein [Bacillus licheniformis]